MRHNQSAVQTVVRLTALAFQVLVVAAAVKLFPQPPLPPGWESGAFNGFRGSAERAMWLFFIIQVGVVSIAPSMWLEAMMIRGI